VNQTNPADDRSDSELYQLLQTHDWNTSCTAVSTDGVTVTFRKHYTSDFPGMEARTVVGKDRADAMRRFLAELESEERQGSGTA
jgi:hypothetical protein